MNAMKSSYVSLNYRAHKKCLLKGLTKCSKDMHNIPPLSKKNLWAKNYAFMVFTEGYRG
jgi:hypothetical protein